VNETFKLIGLFVGFCIYVGFCIAVRKWGERW